MADLLRLAGEHFFLTWFFVGFIASTGTGLSIVVEERRRKPDTCGITPFGIVAWLCGVILAPITVLVCVIGVVDLVVAALRRHQDWWHTPICQLRKYK